MKRNWFIFVKNSYFFATVCEHLSCNCILYRYVLEARSRQVKFVFFNNNNNNMLLCGLSLLCVGMYRAYWWSSSQLRDKRSDFMCWYIACNWLLVNYFDSVCMLYSK